MTRTLHLATDRIETGLSYSKRVAHTGNTTKDYKAQPDLAHFQHLAELAAGIGAQIKALVPPEQRDEVERRLERDREKRGWS